MEHVSLLTNETCLMGHNQDSTPPWDKRVCHYETRMDASMIQEHTYEWLLELIWFDAANKERLTRAERLHQRIQWFLELWPESRGSLASFWTLNIIDTNVQHTRNKYRHTSRKVIIYVIIINSNLNPLTSASDLICCQIWTSYHHCCSATVHL